MKIDPSVQKSHYLSTQSKTDVLPTSQAHDLQNESQPDQQTTPENTLGEDLAKVSAPKTQHHSEPTQIHFDTEPSPLAPSQSPAMAIPNWEQPIDSSETQQIMDMVREAENQNIQSLLDGLDQSLARAQKLMQENLQHYYAKIKPQMDALKKAISEEKAQETAKKTTEQRTAKSELSHMVGEVRNQLAAVMNTQPALAQVLEKALVQAQVLSEKRAR